MRGMIEAAGAVLVIVLVCAACIAALDHRAKAICAERGMRAEPFSRSHLCVDAQGGYHKLRP